MKRTTPVILVMSLFIGLALPGAADSPRPASDSSKSSSKVLQPATRTKSAPTSGSAIIEQVISDAKTRPPVQKPRSAGSAITGVTMSWSSIGGSGVVGGATPGVRISASTGQSVVLQGTTSGFALSGGFWYGSEGCLCPAQFDLNGNGFRDSVDLGMIIDAVFFNGPIVHDPGCPLPRSDANCDGFTDSLDMSYMIDLIFFGGIPPCNPCL